MENINSQPISFLPLNSSKNEGYPPLPLGEGGVREAKLKFVNIFYTTISKYFINTERFLLVSCPHPAPLPEGEGEVED